MENTNQVEIVKKVLELEKEIEKLNGELSSLRVMKYSPAPKPPVREVIKREYPKITPTPMDKSKVGKSILFKGPIGAYNCYKERKEEIEAIRNSDEYKAQCAEADRKFDQMQAEKDSEYEAAKKEYDTVILPEYNEKLEQWTAEQNKKINDIQQKVNELNKELSDIYESTKIVPVKYRTIEALQHVYDIISTSNYDVTYALDDYNQERQRRLDEERLRVDEARLYEQQVANDLAEEGNYIANKARKQSNLASAIGVAQRHNTNKFLKGK